MRKALAALLIAAFGLLATACGKDERSDVTLFLKRDYGSSAPPGQVAPILAPVVRHLDDNVQTPAEILALLRRGPTASEIDEGFLATIPESVRVISVRKSEGTATIEFAGSPPEDFYTHASIVLSLTELPGIRGVALRFKGRPCCVYDLEGNIIRSPATRTLYRGWPGEPCAMRTYPDAVRCRGPA